MKEKNLLVEPVRA